MSTITSTCSECGLEPSNKTLFPPPQSEAPSLCQLCFQLRFGHAPELTTTNKIWCWKNFRSVFLPASFSVSEFQQQQHTLVASQAIPHAQRKKRPILIINTGGTISCVEGPNGLLAPAPMFEYLSTNMECFKDGKLVTEEEYYDSIQKQKQGQKNHNNKKGEEDPDYVLLESPHLMIDSTNSTYNEWNLLALLVSTRQVHFDAIVILHGTDSLAFTSAALSFQLWGLAIPLIITGSQTPIRTIGAAGDGPSNLHGALLFARYAASGVNVSKWTTIDVVGVFIYFNSKVLLGHRVTKLHTSNFDAFDAPSVGCVGFYNGRFTLNVGLLKAIAHSRSVENITLRRHVEKNGGYYRQFLPEGSELFADAWNENDCASNASAKSATPIGTGGGGGTGAFAEATAAAFCAGSSGSPLSPMSVPSSPAADALGLQNITPFADAKHASSIHRVHEMANVIVYFMRPGPQVDGERGLREMVLANAGRAKCVGLFVLGLGAGNVSDSVKDIMLWARNKLAIPVVWSSQLVGIAGGHYAVGLNRAHGTCVSDATFEAVYCRLLAVLSQHVFLQKRRREGVPGVFQRSDGFRDAVESWMAVPHRLSFTVPPLHEAEDEYDMLSDYSVVRDSAVAKYKA